MEEFKHTKGPWKIVKAYQDELKCDMMSIQRDKKGDNISESVCGIFRMKDIDKANAKLIAAAPELLEALIKIKSMGGFGADGEIGKIINEAIKKATE